MLYVQPKLSLYLCDCTLANRNIGVSSVSLSTISSSVSSSLSPDLKGKKKQRKTTYITRCHQKCHSRLQSCQIRQKITVITYPKSVVPGTCAEGRSIRGNAQRTDTVLMSKKNRDPCSFENIPNIYGVVVVAAKQQSS